MKYDFYMIAGTRTEDEDSKQRVLGLALVLTQFHVWGAGFTIKVMYRLKYPESRYEVGVMDSSYKI